MKLTTTIIALLLAATSAHAIDVSGPTPEPEPEAPAEAPSPAGPDSSDGSTACEHYPTGECPGAWINPAPVTDQFYGGKL